MAGNLTTLAEVVATEEEWEGEAEEAEKCVRLEGDGRGELVLEASPGKVISLYMMYDNRGGSADSTARKRRLSPCI